MLCVSAYYMYMSIYRQTGLSSFGECDIVSKSHDNCSVILLGSAVFLYMVESGCKSF